MPTSGAGVHAGHGAGARAGTPRILIIDAGGTFGAAPRTSGATLRHEPSEAASLRDILSKHIDRHLQHYHAWTRQVHAGAGPFRWEFAAADVRIFSENATPSYWGRLFESIAVEASKVCHLGGASLLGVIVLHGTDTMSQVVPAAQLALRSALVPLVFVGSNYPLMQDKSWRRLSLLRSDAWPNLLNAVAFCALGSRIRPHAMLSFGGVVHWPLNLRKLHESTIASPEPALAQEIGAYRAGEDRPAPAESFVFQNLLSRGQYLARNVHGHFVFAVDPTPRDVVGDGGPPVFESGVYGNSAGSPLVARLSASTSPPAVDEREFEQHRAMLIETYGSGTIPTERQHPFHRVLKVCGRCRIPVFLSGNYGIDVNQIYAAPEMAELNVVAYRFSNLIPDTAFPLLWLACERVLGASPELRGRELAEALREWMLARLRSLQGEIGQLVRPSEIVELRPEE